MGLMLEALKRIDARAIAPRPPEQPDPLVPPVAAELPSWCEAAIATVMTELPECGTDFSPEAEPACAGPCGLVKPPDYLVKPPDCVGGVPEPACAGPCEPACAGPYQDLASHIVKQLTPGRPAAVMFTALTDDHPATTLLAQLAPALAERTEGGVLLVDADFRHPHLAGQFGVDAAVCLSDVLEGKANWSDAVRPTATPRLHLLPGGPIAAEKDRSAGQLDLGRLLRELVRQYALVLVAADSLAHGEVGLIAGGCEGTYLVVQLGQASRRTVRQAARVIERCRGRLLGCVAVEGLGIGD